jgi:hypothetical protein
MDVKVCNTCFYNNLDSSIHPCSDCFGNDKWVRRDLYIRDASMTLNQAIKEWVDVKESDQETEEFFNRMKDVVNNPAHYTEHPSGIECIQVTEHMGFNLGNAIKYIWRCDLKKDAIEDLKKAKWYIEREINKRERNNI